MKRPREIVIGTIAIVIWMVVVGAVLARFAAKHYGVEL